jgi:hypothetical protein
MKDIRIKTIEHIDQRYNTVGDYITCDDGSFEIRVSDFGDRKLEFLIAVHELIESTLCRERGITESEIDSFDISFEQTRHKYDDILEPGDSIDAPYHKEHMFSTKIEKMIAEELQVDWQNYCDKCLEKTQARIKNYNK